MLLVLGVQRLQQSHHPSSGVLFPVTTRSTQDHGEYRRLASVASWAEAFRQAGQILGAVAREGTLQRGLREIISYLVIFHWNRLGLPVRTQSILAGAARAAILEMPIAQPQPPPLTLLGLA